MRYLIVFITLTVVMSSCTTKEQKTAAPVTVIPRPAVLDETGGVFTVRPSTTIIVAIEDETREYASDYLVDVFRHRGLDISRNAARPKKRNSIIITNEGADPLLGDEGYILEITKKNVVIRATTAAGWFYGAVTLSQFIPPESGREGLKNAGRINIPCVRIEDRPRFGWRGFMLDCSRTFWPKEEIQRYIDLLALHKLNVFHLHLTDDQGWRVEIKQYPRLTEVGSMFDPRYKGETNGYYSQDDIREIVSYAARRSVTVVPEIDLPGHFTAGLVAYPHLSCTGREDLWIYPFFQRPEGIAGLTEDILCAGNDEVYTFLEDVFDELIGLFPSEYIHIGGDEAPKARWEKCPKCQARIRAEGLRDEHELQSYMTRHMADFLRSRGRKLIGWDEIIEGGLAENAAVMYWRGWIEDAHLRALRSGNEVVMSPTTHCYFDYTYDKISTEHAYSYEPVPENATPDEAELVLGVQANMWTHIARDNPSLDRQVFPRLAATAEVAWTPKKSRDWSDFSRRLSTHLYRLKDMKTEYFEESAQK